MTVERLIALLEDGGLDFRAGDLLDALWLANQGMSLASATAAGAASGATAPPAPLGALQETDRRSPTAGAERQQPTPDSEEAPLESEEAEAQFGTMLYSGGALYAGDRTLSASAVATPAARALPNRLELMRALRPLRQRWPSTHFRELDEEATAELTATLRSANERAIYPVFRPRLERWFECDLVLEDDDAVEIWRDTLRDFASTLRDSGAFREVRSWRLLLPSPGENGIDLLQARLENPAGGRIPAGRLSGGIRRLVLFATHGASDHWRNGIYARLLAAWSKDANVAAVHLLPGDMWMRTALGEAHGRCATSRPAALSAGLEVEAYWWMAGPEPEDVDTLRLPVLELDAGAVAEWSGMLMARGRSAPVFLLDATVSEAVSQPVWDDDLAATERRIDGLREIAPEAFRLAVALSVCPFTIPVAHLMQEAKFQAVDNRQLAELFLSGLIRSLPSAPGLPRTGQTWFAIVEQARPLLRRSIRGEEADRLANELFERVSTHLASITGRPVTMASFTPDPQGRYQIPEWAQPFAKMATSLRDVRPQPAKPASNFERLQQILSPRQLGLLARAFAFDHVTIELLGQAAWQMVLASGVGVEEDGQAFLEKGVLDRLNDLNARMPLYGMRILWLNDKAAANAASRGQLEDWGATVIPCTTTGQMLEHLHDEVDILIVDIALVEDPDAGWQLVRTKQEAFSDLPMIFNGDGGPYGAIDLLSAFIEGEIALAEGASDLFALVQTAARGEAFPTLDDRSKTVPAEQTDAANYEHLGSAALERGDLDEAERYFRLQLEHDTEEHLGDGICRAQHSLGRVALARGDYDKAEHWHRRGLATAQDMREEYFIEGSYTQLGHLAFVRHDLESAESLYGEAMLHARSTPEGEGIANLHLRLGQVAEARRDFVQAERRYREALDAESKWDDSAPVALLSLARMEHRRGDLRAASGWYLTLIQREEEERFSRHLGSAMAELAEIEEKLGNFSGAEQWCERLIQRAGQDDPAATVNGWLLLGSLRGRQGDAPRAEMAFRSALRSAEIDGDGRRTAEVHYALADFLLTHDRLQEALHHAGMALDHHRTVLDRRNEARSWLQLARIESGMTPPGGDSFFRTSLEIARELNDPRLIAEILLNIGDSAAHRRDIAAARLAYGEAIELREQVGDQRAAAQGYWALGRLMSTTGEYEGAVANLEKAGAILERLGDRTLLGSLELQLAELKARGGRRSAPTSFPVAAQIGPACVELVRQFDGPGRRRPDGLYEAGLDPMTGRWTIGWGSTGPDIKSGTIWTESQCEERLVSDLQKLASKVARRINAPTTQNQFDALVSLVSDIGVKAFATSALLKKHRAGNFAGAAREFARWNKSAGKVLAGLQQRRKQEAMLYRGDSSPQNQ